MNCALSQDIPFPNLNVHANSTSLYHSIIRKIHNAVMLLHVQMRIATISNIVQRLNVYHIPRSARSFSVFDKMNQVLHISGKVKPFANYNFHRATLECATQSISSGIARYDIFRGYDNPDEFLISEVHANRSSFNDHRQSKYCRSWGEELELLLDSNIEIEEYATIFPPKSNWLTNKSASNIDVNEYVSTVDWPDSNDYKVEEFLSLSHSKNRRSLLAVVVHISVKQECESDFIALTLNNCTSSLCEPGVHRFDFLRNVTNTTAPSATDGKTVANKVSQFILIEMYNSEEAPVQHKSTDHYLGWRDAVEHMMACPRTSKKYFVLFPQPLHHHTSSTFFPNIIATTLPSSSSSPPSPHATPATSASPPHPACQYPHSTSASLLQYGVGLQHLSSIVPFAAPNILMGSNTATQSLRLSLVRLGIKSPFLVVGASGRERYSLVFNVLSGYTETWPCFVVESEPTPLDVEEGSKRAVAGGCDGVVAFGGGSVIDAAKAIAAKVTNRGKRLPDRGWC